MMRGTACVAALCMGLCAATCVGATVDDLVAKMPAAEKEAGQAEAAAGAVAANAGKPFSMSCPYFQYPMTACEIWPASTAP